MRGKSYHSAEMRVFKLDYEELMRRLKEYASRLVSNDLAELVILIGSLARGDYTPFSDIDVLIVIDDDLRADLMEYIDESLPLDIEPRVITISKFLEMASRKRRTIIEEINYGIYLAGRKEILEKAKQLAQLN